MKKWMMTSLFLATLAAGGLSLAGDIQGLYGGMALRPSKFAMGV